LSAHVFAYLLFGSAGRAAFVSFSTTCARCAGFGLALSHARQLIRMEPRRPSVFSRDPAASAIVAPAWGALAILHIAGMKRREANAGPLMPAQSAAMGGAVAFGAGPGKGVLAHRPGPGGGRSAEALGPSNAVRENGCAASSSSPDRPVEARRQGSRRPSALFATRRNDPEENAEVCMGRRRHGGREGVRGKRARGSPSVPLHRGSRGWRSAVRSVRLTARDRQSRRTRNQVAGSRLIISHRHPHSIRSWQG